MNSPIICIFVILFAVLIILLIMNTEIKNLKSKLNPVSPINEGEIVVSSLKPLPNFEDIDPTSETLNSLLSTMKLEGWTCATKEDYSTHGSRYDVDFFKPNSKTMVRSAIRVTDKNVARLSWFHLYYEENGETESISFSDISNEKVIKFIWSHIDNNNTIEIEGKRKELTKAKQAEI